MEVGEEEPKRRQMLCQYRQTHHESSINRYCLWFHWCCLILVTSEVEGVGQIR